MRRKLTIMLATAAVLALIVATAASSMLPTYETAAKAVINKYEKLSKIELIETMKLEFAEAGKNGDYNSLIPLVSIFDQRKEEYTPDEFLSLIEDNNIDNFMRETLVQILFDLSSFDKGDTRLSVLLNKNLPDGVKQALITYFGNKGGITIDDLVLMASNKNEDISFNAIKRLNQVNPQRAYTLSKSILQNYRTVNEGQLKAAIRVFGNLDGFTPIGSTLKTADADKELLFNVTEIVLNGNYKSTTKDSVMFTIADMNTYESMEYLMHHDKVDILMKKGVVDRNYHTLIEMLENNPTEEQIAFAIECMELWPINEVAKPLEEAITQKSQLISTNGAVTQSRVADVLDLIENQGEPANPAWNQ